MKTIWRVTSILALGASGCVGEIGDRPPAPAKPAETFTPAAATLHRLTLSQYQNSIRDLFGDDIVLPTDLEVDTMLHGFSTVGASEITISPLAAEQFENASYDVAKQIFDDASKRGSFVGCAPASSDDPCIPEFLERFGLRAWRRPMAQAEVDQMAGLADAIGKDLADPWEGIRFAVAGLLQSPHFLFRIEVGAPGADGRLALTSWEMASRLSYLLLNSTPDDDLLAAAERGDLDSVEGVRAEAERLLASPRSKEALRHFYSEFLNLQRLDDLTKNAEVYPQMSATLGASMRGEIEHVFDYVVFERDTDFRKILDTRETFVNAELARLYRLPDMSRLRPGFKKISFPEDGPRAGLMSTAGILALYAHNTATSPTLRGKFIRMNLLCQDVPPPPPGVKTNLDGPSGATGKKTMREKLEAHRTDPACASCHQLMDPLGLGLEHFDAIGAYRESENGYPIDATSDVDGVPFDGARELGALLRDLPGVGECVARRFYRHGLGHLEETAEESAIVGLAARFGEHGYRFKQLVLALATSEAFRFVSAPEEE